MTTKFPWPEIELCLHQLRLCADDLKARFPDVGITDMCRESIGNTDR